MREILFRGKRTDNGEWIYGYPLIDTAECSLKAKGECACPHDGSWAEIAYWSDERHEYVFQEVVPETVSQYTGLTDKNGQKIFEGDIICVTNAMGKNNYPVVCQKGAFWLYDELLIDNEGLDFLASYIPSYIEVVGNIHDNPELLGEVKE